MKYCGILKYVMEKSTDAFQRALYEFGDEKNREAFTPLKDFVLCKTGQKNIELPLFKYFFVFDPNHH